MLNLHIIKGGGPPIVERDWIEILSLLLKGTFILISFSPVKDNNYVFEEFPIVFWEALGCYKPKTFKLYLKDDTVKPVFCKQRVALKDKVNWKIDK